MKKSERIKRCIKCNLPSNFPSIKFDDNGVCNYCINNQQTQYHYLGIEELKKEIDRILSNSSPNRKYDCAVGLSGGRDSSFLLYLAKEVLRLNVLAVSVDHDFITPFARQNIKTLVKRLGVDIHYIKNDMLNYASRKSVLNWAKNPDVAMCVSFCTGCRYGGSRNNLPEYVNKQQVPILFLGDTPNETKTDYRLDLICDGKERNKFNLFIGYGKRLLRNPSYFNSIKTLYYQYLDFTAKMGKINRKHFPAIIKPFFYVEWKESEVVSKLYELGWRYDDREFKSSWRADCYIGVLRQFFYKKALGFNDINAYYAGLIRNGDISHEEAMKHIQIEGENDEGLVRSILMNYYGVDYDSIKNKLNNRYC